MSKTQNVDPFDGQGKSVDPVQVTFNKPGDWVRGTFVSKKLIQGKDKPVYLYEIKGIDGEFHRMDVSMDDNGNNIKKIIEPSIKIVPGEYYKVWGGKDVIDNVFQKSPFGMIIGVHFKDVTPNKDKTKNPFKVFNARQFDIDDSWMGDTSGDING